MSKNQNVYVCRKLFLYYHLTKEGFKPISHRPDKYNCDKVVWIYEDSPMLRDAVEDFYAHKPENLITRRNHDEDN